MKYKYYLRDTKSPRNLEKFPDLFLGEGFDSQASQLAAGYIIRWPEITNFLTCSLVRGLTRFATQLGMVALLARAN